MDAFVLKIIAIITMIFDHTGYLIFDGHFSYFNYIGRLAFPIFAFQITQGYIHTKNLKKYLVRLLTFAVISQIPFMLFRSMITDGFSLNIFFTLILGLISIIAYDKSPNKILGLIPVILLCFVANLINTDYGFYGVSIIFLFYVFRNNKYLLSISFIIATISRYASYVYSSNFHQKYIFLCLCTILSLVFILFYNGKKGRNTNYILYLFYPIHLLLIYGIYLLK